MVCPFPSRVDIGAIRDHYWIALQKQNSDHCLNGLNEYFRKISGRYWYVIHFLSSFNHILRVAVFSHISLVYKQWKYFWEKEQIKLILTFPFPDYQSLDLIFVIYFLMNIIFMFIWINLYGYRSNTKESIFACARVLID